MFREKIAKNIETILSGFVNTSREEVLHPKVKRKRQLSENREVEIVKVSATGLIKDIQSESHFQNVQYDVHYKYLMKQGSHMYLEEEVENRMAIFEHGEYCNDLEIVKEERDDECEYVDISIENSDVRIPYEYDRLKAVQYAEKWWNSYNPSFKKFEVDCTNFISQCLHAGGAPMKVYPSRSKGWWMRSDNWSYSWTVANSLRWYLPSSSDGLRAVEVSRPEDLHLGDIICYDFQGDGRFDHNTIVTAKDANGMPLVNAHTSNSRARFWNYEDSTAYTPNIKYKFLTIVDDR